MKICNFLKAENIFLDISLSDKDAVLQFLADTGRQIGLVKNRKQLYDGLNCRERIMTTGVGEGIALPHASAPDVSDAALILLRLATPVEFDSIDARPVDIVLALILPEGQTHLHLQLLAGVSRLCKSPEFLALIRLQRDSAALWKALRSLEEQIPFH
jgi:mannitol/fructose-specific phosphotransferase system IIA component (Ntr-type)